MALSNKAKSYIEKHYSSKSAKEIADTLNIEQDEVQQYINDLKEPISLRKKALFYVITCSVPVLFFVILEIALQSVDYLGNTDLFVNPRIQSNEYLIPNPNFAARYFFYTNTIPNPSTDVFLKDKPDNGYRVFAMGGSSAAGYPYGFNGTFSRLVDDVLTDAMPQQNVEVVNVGISAISSYTLFDQVDEIIAQKPDAIMIYAGHNEFYGALGVGSNENLGGFPAFVRFYLKLQRLKTFLFLRDLIVDSGKWLADMFGSAENKAKPTATLMERIVKSSSIEVGGPNYELAMIQFRSNMEAIIEPFEAKGIPVYISTIASNTKDQPPFVSIQDGNLPPAQSVYEKAESILQNGDTLSAKKEYIYAKDLDGLKFRAPSQINQIITELSQAYDHVKLVPTLSTFEQHSPEGIVGNELMLEHLHPNSEGYFLIGKSFAEIMLDDLNKSATSNLRNIDWEDYRDRMYLSSFDHRMAWHRVQTLKQGFPFVRDGSQAAYQTNYQYRDFVDSLAFINVHGNARWDASKVELGQHYKQEGKDQQAIYEYLGLIRNQPWNESPYIFAARIYLDNGNFEEAKPLLEKAYELAPKEAYVTKMLGAIALNAGNTERAVKLLEESYAVNPNDPQMLYNLSGAYGTNRNFEKALEIANHVTSINPNFPGIQAWKQRLETIINSRNNN